MDMFISLKSSTGVFAFSISIHILREASALYVLLQWALPEPLTVERATSTALTLSFSNLRSMR